MAEIELDELAMSARESEHGFEVVLKSMEHRLGWIISKLVRQWPVELEELKQQFRIEVWNAVQRYEPAKGPFVSFCRFTVENHLKTYIRRYVYGRKYELNNHAVRINAAGYDQEWNEIAVDQFVPKEPSAEEQFFRSYIRYSILRTLRDINLTSLERASLGLFYIQNYSYREIKDMLKLSTSKSVDNALVRVKRKVKQKPELLDMYQDLANMPP